MTFATEFPDFPTADMPAIPAGFEDCSWHNDACPYFYNGAKGLGLFVDYADVTAREYDDAARFSLRRTGPDGDPGEDIISSDDWLEILAAIGAA